MVGDMENYKIKVNNEAESKEVQELYIALGATGSVRQITSKWVCLYYKQITFYDLLPNVDFKQVTIQHLRDLVVLKRNSVDDATHIFGLSKVLKLETKDYKIWDATYNVWVDYIGSQTDFRRGLKPIGKEVKMKEYLDTNYELRSVKQTSGDNLVPKGWIEIPEGAEEYRANHRFYKNNGELFYSSLLFEWTKSSMPEYITLWKRNPETPNTSTQEKLKFIEKWLNGEKIQYILGIESDKIQSEKTQWHNFTEGAMQYIKRSDIKFREAPKYVTINGIEFKSVESLLKHVKNNFDLEDGDKE